jgi:flagella basal body P-ring formation protein FlgA
MRGLLALLAALAASAAHADDAPRWLSDQVQAYLLARAQDGPIRIAIPPLEGFSAADLDADTVDVSITSAAAPPFSGDVPLTIVVARDGKELARRDLTATVSGAEVAVVAARTLARGDVLAREHLTLAPVDAPGERRSAAASIEEAVGKRLRRKVEAGAPIRSAWLEERPLVKRGEPVRITAARGRLRIESTGIARQDGRPGQIVRVENPSSRREVIGRVGEDGAVHVSF